MEAFVWKPQFDTGIDSVDRQHRQIVDLINRLGAVTVDDRSLESVVDPILGELTDYAFNHFSEEEDLMEDRGVDRRHIEHHQLEHSQFIEQVEKIWDSRGAQQNSVKVLTEYLSSWLASHILEEDQSMARQMKLIGNGGSPEEAYKGEQRKK